MKLTKTEQHDGWILLIVVVVIAVVIYMAIEQQKTGDDVNKKNKSVAYLAIQNIEPLVPVMMLI